MPDCMLESSEARAVDSYLIGAVIMHQWRLFGHAYVVREATCFVLGTLAPVEAEVQSGAHDRRPCVLIVRARVARFLGAVRGVLYRARGFQRQSSALYCSAGAVSPLDLAPDSSRVNPVPPGLEALQWHVEPGGRGVHSVVPRDGHAVCIGLIVVVQAGRRRHSDGGLPEIAAFLAS